MCSEIEIKKKLDIVEVLSILNKDEDYHVRCCVAENKNTSKEILETLSKDKYWNVRYYVARNKNTPKEILEVLSKDECSIRYNIAKKH